MTERITTTTNLPVLQEVQSPACAETQWVFEKDPDAATIIITVVSGTGERRVWTGHLFNERDCRLAAQAFEMVSGNKEGRW